MVMTPAIQRMVMSSIPKGLITGLAAYWPLAEQSGNRSDLINQNTLTDNATVTGNPGPGGRLSLASQFTAANSEFFSAADSAKLRASLNQFSFTAWAYLDSKPAALMQVVTKYDFGVGADYALTWNNATDRFEFNGTSDNSNLTTVVGNNLGAPALATWYFLCARYDGTNLCLSANGGVENTQAMASQGTGTTAGFRIGASASFGSAGSFWNGRICGVGFWKRALSIQERDWLYNKGSPRVIPFNR